MTYPEYVGRLIDQGKSNDQIAKALLRADKTGRITIPFKIWKVIDNDILVVAMAPRKARSDLIEAINGFHTTSLFFEEPKWVKNFRYVLQHEDRSFQTLEKRSKWRQKLSQNLPLMDDWFGDHKRPVLRSLNLLNDNNQWSEFGFQKLIRLLKQARRRKIEPHAALMRLWVNDLADLDGSLTKTRQNFDWLLCHDGLSRAQINLAKEIAAAILSLTEGHNVKIGDTITRKQAETVDKVLSWLFNDPNVRDRNRYLTKLTFLINGNALNWPRLMKAFEFICHHLKEAPDFEKLKDYLDGYIDFEGRGEYQTPSERPPHRPA